MVGPARFYSSPLLPACLAAGWARARARAHPKAKRAPPARSAATTPTARARARARARATGGGDGDDGGGGGSTANRTADCHNSPLSLFCVMRGRFWISSSSHLKTPREIFIFQNQFQSCNLIGWPENIDLTGILSRLLRPCITPQVYKYVRYTIHIHIYRHKCIILLFDRRLRENAFPYIQYVVISVSVMALLVTRISINWAGKCSKW